MFATILLPQFYLQAVLRHQPLLAEKPLGVLDASERKAVLWQVNEPAAAAGVETGMTPSQALARCLSLVIKGRARESEEQINAILLHHAFLLSPFVEATAPGICTVEMRRKSAFESKLQNTIALLGKCGLLARAGIADNPDTSFLVANLSDPVIQIDEAKNFLAPLPLETLTIS